MLIAFALIFMLYVILMMWFKIEELEKEQRAIKDVLNKKRKIK